ncbi:MAG: tetratricopeptide repeat protein [Candidatus Aminicenantes bacterium]|nr:tetratricopeptide repeat protein [Candidatus Aminicenantes bacterium]
MRTTPAKAVLLILACLPLVVCASAQKKMEKAREKDPNYQYNLGSFHLNNNDLEQAVRAFNRALELNPRLHLAHNGLGLVYSLRGDLPAAAKAFENALAADPQFTEARNNLGMTYQEMGYLDKAEEQYKKAIADLAYRTREMPYYNLARLYLAKELLETALDTVQKALIANTNMVLAYNLKGMILEKMDRLSEAITAYEIAARRVPEEVQFAYNLAVACYKAGERDKARTTFEEILPRVTDVALRDQINAYLEKLK